MSEEKQHISKHVITTNTIGRSIWKTIVVDGVETMYEVNRKGIVRNRNTLKVMSRYGYHNRWQESHIYGLSVNKKVVRLDAHRIMASIFIPIPKSLEKKGYTQLDLLVVAKNGDYRDTSIKNLKWVTKSDQVKKEMETRRKNLNSLKCRTVITDEIAKNICEMLQGKKSVFKIAKKFNISTQLVYHIKNRETWKHVSEKYKW